MIGAVLFVGFLSNNNIRKIWISKTSRNNDGLIKSWLNCEPASMKGNFTWTIVVAVWLDYSSSFYLTKCSTGYKAVLALARVVWVVDAG